MSELKNRVAYLQGLAEGVGLEPSTKEGKLFTAIIEVLADIAGEFQNMSNQQAELEGYIEAIDEDLGDLEEDFYDEYDDDEYDDDEYDDDEYDDDEYDDDDCECDYVEVECPKCHDLVRFDCSILEDGGMIEVACPNCDEIVYLHDEKEEDDKD